MTEADRRHSWHTLEGGKKSSFVNFVCIIWLIHIDTSPLFSFPLFLGHVGLVQELWRI